MARENNVKVRVKIHSQLPIEEITPSGNNPRIINENSFEFLELVNSIKAMGVIVPVHVRLLSEGGYELLAGERRLLAAKKAGLRKINAINHGLISDEEAFEITFAENFAREDLTALEQGKAVATLFEKYKGDTKAVAAKIGKSVSWVLQRRAIENDLVKEWKEKIAKDPVLALWTAAHLQLIARYPADIQKELLEYYDDEGFGFVNYGEGLISVAALEKELAEQLMLLSKVIFDVNDKTLNKNAGTCTKCNKRTSCRPGLFDDYLDEEKIKANDRCLDKNCWQNKEKIFLQGRFQQESKKHKSIMCIATDSPDYNKRWDMKQTYPNFIAEWKASKEGAKKAVPALVVSGVDAGQIRWVTILEGKSLSGPIKRVKGQPTPLAERRKMLEAKRDARFLSKLEEIISEKKVTELVSKANISNTRMVMALATVFGVDLPYEGTTPYHHDKAESKRAWESVFKIADGSTIERLWESVRTVLCNNLRYSGPVTQTEKSRMDEAKQLAALFELDVKEIYKEIREEIPEPKSWRNLNADGTPKAKSDKNSKRKKGDGKKSKKKKSKSS